MVGGGLLTMCRPVVGGFAAQYMGWRWTQWCMIFVTLAVYVIGLPMKETYKPIILKRRAKKRGLDIKPSGGPGTAAMKRAVIIGLFRPLHMLLTEVKRTSHGYKTLH